MALGVEQAIALLLRDGDPARSISGLDALEGFGLYDDALSTRRRIHVGLEPDTPDEVVTVILEAGGPPLGGGPPNAVGRQPAFTIRSRSASYARALELAHEAAEILDWYEGVSNSVPFFRITANTEPIPLGQDTGARGGRWVASQTFSAVTKRYPLT